MNKKPIEPRVYRSQFWQQAAVNFIDKQGLDAVTILAYASLVGLVPFLAILFGVFALSDSFAVFQAEVIDKVLHFLLPEATPQVEAYLLKFAQKAGQLQGVGIISMFAIALILLWTIDKKINLMWHRHYQRRWWVSLLHYLGVSLLGPLILGAGLVLSSLLLAAPILPDLFWMADALKQLPFFINVVGFWFLYRFVPAVKVSSRAAWVGALLTTLELELLKFGFGVYVKWFPTYDLIYGAFAVIPLFLLWLYLLWLVIIFNASVVRQIDLVVVKPPSQSD
ncbi:ribonuclease BN [Hydrogenovibrio sp. SC-1]|uniref:YihY family inner membrane protein n=1 Tax=Hydrogenovibrio sp. SC-1 TaxID=2065820 RepID=UPI000C7B5F03|nr:YihY family inner membrane protein [Hydrogenovibrio sp. SC-1]PLA74470.1 ribonuclease BN [Hydrogenovibrio sp. SC-1]